MNMNSIESSKKVKAVFKNNTSFIFTIKKAISKSFCIIFLYSLVISCNKENDVLENKDELNLNSIAKNRQNEVDNQPRGVVGIITVDWEGAYMRQKDIDGMVAFREKYPSIKMLHYLNPAYYTKSETDKNRLDSQDINRMTNSVLRVGDEHGLHIHPWRSLVESSGVSFQSSPSIADRKMVEKYFACDSDKKNDCGHDIALNTYTNVEDIRKIIRKSIEILTNNGFNRPRSFRSGAWVSNNQIIEALGREGILYDSSAVPPELISSSFWNGKPLESIISNLWRGIKTNSQPYSINLEGKPKVMEIPDNGALADYMEAEKMLDVFKKNVEKWRENSDHIYFYVIGFHQETASRYLNRVDKVVKLIEDYTRENNIPFQWAQYPVSRYFPN